MSQLLQRKHKYKIPAVDFILCVSVNFWEENLAQSSSCIISYVSNLMSQKAYKS